MIKFNIEVILLQYLGSDMKNMIWLTSILEIISKKTEYSQAITRFGLSLLLTIYYFFHSYLDNDTHHTDLLYICIGYLTLSTFWLSWVNYIPDVAIRKYLSLVLDILIISLALVYAGPYHLGIFLLLSWVILGYGYRYGSIFVIYSSILSLIFLFSILMFVPSWKNPNPHILETLFVFSLVMLFKFLIIANLENEIKKRTIFEKRAHRYENKAMRDPLTNLCNRDFATTWLAKKARNNNRVGVLFLDLDNFKVFNDNYGHHVGDKVLINISKRLINCVRTRDVVCRYAGDEFIILINDEDNDTINEIASRITTALRKSVEIEGGKRLTVTASIGIALLGIHGNTPTEVLRCADSAMYLAKRKGRNRVAWFEEKVKG